MYMSVEQDKHLYLESLLTKLHCAMPEACEMLKCIGKYITIPKYFMTEEASMQSQDI